ncbi:hypothetical protein LPUS_05346 [Lasallia pustulata]|uniref:Leucine-rich repeat domain, L domain-like n=1 Tax=Lasallia pustulata TaxID=136370 RepID=A0A1W5CYM3_9LECA|nr:hypothetical protein LPUS_05346 [Lasallia pustulata]
MKAGTAQSFLESSLTRAPLHDEAVVDDNDDKDATGAGSCNCCCRCGRSRDWKQVGSRGTRRSKSYSSLRTGVAEITSWDWEPPKRGLPVSIETTKPCRPGEAPLERLPVEILDHIIAQLALEVPPNNYSPRNVDLISCLLTSRTIHAAAVTTLYHHITIPHSTIFSKFLGHLFEKPALGTMVRRLDFSHFTSIGLGRTQQMNSTIQNMTAKTLLQCLELTPTVQEVLLQEHLDNDMDTKVLRKLFYDLPNLRALDFCAASSGSFVEAFSSALTTLGSPANIQMGIRRLSLHECFTLPTSAFENLLPRLPKLTHLDLCHTRVTDKALASIPHTARLTHLNLGRCIQISGAGVVDFITAHPAVRSLVYLNLSCDISRYRLLWESDVERILSLLPSTLRSLSISGAKVLSEHTELIIPLTKHLEELSLGFAELSMRDINSIFEPKAASDDDDETNGGESEWTPPTLRYLDLTGIKSVAQSALFSSSSNILRSTTRPFEVLELGDKIISALRDCTVTNKRLGWVVKELGRRGWYVREPTQEEAQVGETRGRKAWKMGAMWWGMRKIPVAWGEVGGLYGHYMFKR